MEDNKAVESTAAVETPAAAPATAPAAPAAKPNSYGERRYERPSYGDRNGPDGRPMRQRRKKVCQICVDRDDTVDYKDVAKLRKFISERSKIIPRRVTGTCAKHQRDITTAVKRARHLALLPYTSD